jgi:hypothetical protein
MKHLAFVLLTLLIVSPAFQAQDQTGSLNSLKILSPDTMMVPLIEGMTGGSLGRYLPVIVQDKDVKCEFAGPKDMAGKTIEICTSGFSLSRAINPSLVLDKNVSLSRACNISLNSTGGCKFDLPGMSSGVRQILALDENRTRVLSSAFAMVVAGNISVEAPSEVSPGDIMVVEIRVPEKEVIAPAENASNSTGSNNSSKAGELCYYGSMLVSEEDCLNTSIAIKNDEKGSPVSLIITRANTTGELPTTFNKSSLNSMLPIMPSNSAVGVQESREGHSALSLITDESLTPGRYVLFSAAYSTRGSLLGVNQSSVVAKAKKR